MDRIEGANSLQTPLPPNAFSQQNGAISHTARISINTVNTLLRKFTERRIYPMINPRDFFFYGGRGGGSLNRKCLRPQSTEYYRSTGIQTLFLLWAF